MIGRRVAITGAYGFLGWHTACRLRAVHEIDALRLGRAHFSNSDRLVASLADVDVVIHVAGVNRGSDSAVEKSNVALAETLAHALDQLDRPLDVVYANSTQAELDNPYGRGKQLAAERLGASVRGRGGNFADLLLPNLFGEHGRPGYNSFVATFAHEIAGGRKPFVTADRDIDLLHVQNAAAALIAAAGWNTRERLSGEPVRVSHVRDLFQKFHELYSKRGEIPDISRPLHRDLFNTYRAASFPDMWPKFSDVHADQRGRLFETVRSHGGTGMTFMSTTSPGEIRGDHYHLQKVERFCVVRGEAEIQLRRLLHDTVTTFRLSGDSPSFVDMPTFWVHNIRNIGNDDLVTMFWADQLLSAETPDQYPEDVVTETHK